ncbi:RteC domain-containing protein [Alistipes finegoldii]|uniref:RteC domain-containing protein n=1 Tax=Alistipes finegoldii TaxID=214856 RepID=UPI001D06693F|nr:RteC domain-containing protein [Alistipes finegoldii]MCB6684056.1 RteC domain-containing protein [Alistipes finegoldii]
MKTHKNKKNPSKNLRFLENSHFMKLLCTSLENNSGQCDLERLKASYARFVGSVQRLVASEQCAPLDMLHALSRARNRLVRLRACGEQPPAALVALLEGAVAHLEFEIRMVYLRIEHPAVTDRLPQSDKPCSALYLAEPFTPTDLMELITALHTAGVGRRIDGTRANVEQLVELFSWMFNVRINNPIQCRRGVINRKLRLTRFLDLLRNSLIEESQR